MFEAQRFVDFQENPNFRDPKTWLSGDDDNSSLTGRRSESLLANSTTNTTGPSGSLDRVLYKDLVEIVPLVQSLIDRKGSSSFTQRGSIIYTKTPSRESLAKKLPKMPAQQAAILVPNVRGVAGSLGPRHVRYRLESMRRELNRLLEALDDRGDVGLLCQDCKGGENGVVKADGPVFSLHGPVVKGKEQVSLCEDKGWSHGLGSGPLVGSMRERGVGLVAGLGGEVSGGFEEPTSTGDIVGPQLTDSEGVHVHQLREDGSTPSEVAMGPAGVLPTPGALVDSDHSSASFQISAPATDLDFWPVEVGSTASVEADGCRCST